MASYSMSVRTVNTAAASAAAELIAGATQRCRIREIGISENAATAGVFGIGRPAAAGITPTSPILGLAHDPGEAAAVGKIATAWATAPTVPANFLRRASLNAGVGAGIIWQFARDAFVLNVNATAVLWIIALAPVVDAWIEWEE